MTKQEITQYIDRLGDLSDKLMAMAPGDRLDWKPDDGNWFTLGQELTHIAESFGLFGWIADGCPPLSDAQREAMSKTEPRSPQEARKVLAEKRAYVRERLNALSDADYQTKQVDTGFGLQGPIFQVLTFGTEHTINEKMRLFCYIKQLGVSVDTGTLYFGEAPKPAEKEAVAA